MTIELSWKSSAIEGNTYNLLETETLLKEGITAPGKKAEEALMLLNHKKALEFVRGNLDLFKTLKLSVIEKLHEVLTEGLQVTDGLRKRVVIIIGSSYRPPENEFQVREVLEQACELIQQQTDPFSKALLALLLINYIQPFEDGNKRTARILVNALLWAENSCPLSFRSVSIQDYKSAILLFYELNYLPAFKRLFLEQFQFAVKNYFRAS